MLNAMKGKNVSMPDKKYVRVDIIKTFLRLMHDIVVVIKLISKNIKFKQMRTHFKKGLWPNPNFRSINSVDNSVIVK